MKLCFIKKKPKQHTNKIAIHPRSQILIITLHVSHFRAPRHDSYEWLQNLNQLVRFAETFVISMERMGGSGYPPGEDGNGLPSLPLVRMGGSGYLPGDGNGLPLEIER